MISEFTIEGRATSDTRSPTRWISSHLRKDWGYVAGALLGSLSQNLLNSLIPVLVGVAFNQILEEPPDSRALTLVAGGLLTVVLLRGACDLVAAMSAEIVAKRLERDARDDLYVNLLGKSQTFHNRQRVGDLMARAANDVRQLNLMINPGMSLIIDSMLGLVVPIVAIGLLDWRLLPPPLLFSIAFYFALRYYMKQLNPVSTDLRVKFGDLNAGLQETIGGIEVVKSTAQEAFEEGNFNTRASAYRNATVSQGRIQARYLPTLILSVTYAGALALGIYMVTSERMTIGTLVAYLGLIGLLRFPTFISIFSFSLVQLGLVSARRIMDLITQETELDQNEAGYSARIEGEIVFDDVTFGYEDEPVLSNVSFRAAQGDTVAIVGETGSGKSTLTRLVNRIYDLDEGRVLVDGVDVRDWNIDSLRSQISTIEQDIMLFSRPISENIGFSMGQQTDDASIMQAARDAQADQFISELPEGYRTVIGERGVTLSGGQRQRLAIARALITDPRILIIDDSTSAVDSQTEAEIQRAIDKVMEGRTTLLITHRLSQIRRADQILLLRGGELVASGSHEELVRISPLYRRIFARYDAEDASDDSSRTAAAARCSDQHAPD